MTPAFRFATDENLDERLITGLRREFPNLDLLRVVDEGLDATPDPEILEWAAKEDRIVLTHDVRTMPKFGWERVEKELPMPGILATIDQAPLGRVLDDLFLIIESIEPSEYRDRVSFLPFP